ncbi:MAG: hypothetical protein HFG41_07690 [Coprococcus sp.]|nr:hypothetical protein [Coprococcus sp.]
MSIKKKIKMDETIEEEQLYPENYEKEIIKPFNPKEVDIISQTMVISNIVDQLRFDDILLEPDFQRHPDLWNSKQQSRLIESIRRIRNDGLIEIVLPWTDEGYGVVVKTTGRTIRETKKISEIIEERYSGV